jgi:cytochrome P450
MTTTDATAYPPMPDAEELALFVERPLVALPQLFARYGDPICVPSHVGPMVVTADPDTAEKVLKNHLSRGPLHRRTEPVQGAGITIQAGPEWRRTRSMINPMFTHSRMRALSHLVAEGVELGLAGLDRYVDSGEVVDLQAFFPNVTLGVLMHAMFSDSMPLGEMAAFIDDFGVLSRWKGGLVKTAFAPAGTPVPFEDEGRAAKARTDAVIDRIVAERRADPGARNDLLALLLETRDVDDGTGLTDDEIRNNMTTLFMGGFDTTAFGLTWTLACALRSPRGLAPLQAVADVVKGRSPAADDVPALAYLKAAFDEGLRLQGHPLMPRQLAYDDEIGGYALPEGTMVTVSSWVMHRRADLWEHPDEFRPERYLGDENKGRNRWQSLAFGGGPRFCVGINFAYLEGTFVLATLLSRYDVALVPGWELRPTYVFNVILDGGLPVTLRRR